VTLQSNGETQNDDRQGLLGSGVYYSSATHRYELQPGDAPWNRAGIEFQNTGAISFHVEEQDRSASPHMTIAEWDAAQRVVIQSSGQVGIGTSDPMAELEVIGDAEISGNLYVGWTKIADDGGVYYAP
jgi:hypothetical protein